MKVSLSAIFQCSRLPSVMIADGETNCDPCGKNCQSTSMPLHKSPCYLLVSFKKKKKKEKIDCLLPDY